MSTASVKDLIDELVVIESRTEEIRRSEANTSTQKSKRADSYERLRSHLNLPNTFTERDLVTAAEARIGRFYMCEHNKETRESAKANDR